MDDERQVSRWDEQVVEYQALFPAGDEISWAAEPAASARLLVGRASQRFEGIGPGDLKEFGVTTKDLVEYRDALRFALLGAVREGGTGETSQLRGVAVAYLGALRVGGAGDVVAGIASSPDEVPEVRALAVESMVRSGEGDVQGTLVMALDDPDRTVRERAVRALAQIEGGQELIASVADRDDDAEVRRVAREALGGEPEPLEGGETMDGGSGRRPFGRGVPTQTQGRVPQDVTAFGMRDLVSEERLAAARPDTTTSLGYEVLGESGGFVRLRLRGPAASTVKAGEGVRLWAGSGRTVVDVPAELLLPGRPLPLRAGNDGSLELPRWTPDGPGSAEVTELGPDGGTVWAGSDFAIRVAFESPDDGPVVLLRLHVELPVARAAEAVFAVSPEEQAAGVKVVPGYLAEATGPGRVEATVYTAAGGAAASSAELVVLPPNPISMTLSPTTTGRNNKGPAHLGSDGKFYCYARGTVTNAFPREARVGPDVTCSISDGGTVLETFNFSIGAFTVPANGWGGFNLVIWVGPGSPTHDVFTWHGDVTITFTLATSEGFISASAVWVSMARVDLALCFVGDFPDARRFAVQSIVDNEASAILESQNLYIGNTWTFLIPSSHPDHGRFRDIRMNDNKAQDCTAGAVEASELRGGWSSPNVDWLDVWFVDSLSGPACASSVLGFSPTPGPTDKDSTDSGFVVKVNGEVLDTTNGRQRFGLTVAHELGHYLGLGHHPTDNTNFMWPFILVTNTNVEYAQFWDMADHGFVRDFTP